MTEKEIEKCKDIIEAWKKEASEMPPLELPQSGFRLDGGNCRFAKLSRKYEKLIEDRLGKKIWNK